MAIPVALPGMPPNGVQDVGEFGPYYIYEGNELVELPSMNIVRDYDYAYKVTEQDLRLLIEDGWLNSFEASALLSHRPLKSRSIVVISDNGWMYGAKTHYTWCIRVDIKLEPVEGVTIYVGDSNPDGEFNAGSDDQEELLHYGRHVLWPIPPERATNARDRWSTDETLKNSRLVEVYRPSEEPFSYKHVPAHAFVKTSKPSTLRLLQSLQPVAIPRKTHSQRPRETLVQFQPAEESVNTSLAPRDPRYTSSVVSVGLARRAARCMRFTATHQTEWSDLNGDEQEHIWESLAREALGTYGGVDSLSLRMWLTLRSVCRQSRAVVERMTLGFMEKATCALVQSRATLMVSDAIAVRDLLAPRGISSHLLQCELNHHEYSTCAEGRRASDMWASVYPYMRIRSGKRPTDSPPAPKSLRADVKTAPLYSERSSLRIGIKRSKEDPADHLHEIERVADAFTWTTITLKLDVTKPSPNAKVAKKARIATQQQPAAPPPAPPPTPARVASSKCVSKRKVPLPSGVETCKWVYCDACNKCRRLPNPEGLSDYLWERFLPKNWYCDMHPSGVTCDDPEDDVDEDELTLHECAVVDESYEDDPTWSGNGAGPSVRSTPLRKGLRRMRSQ